MKNGIAGASLVPDLHFAARGIQPGVLCEARSLAGDLFASSGVSVHELEVTEATALLEKLDAARKALGKVLKAVQS